MPLATKIPIYTAANQASENNMACLVKKVIFS